MLKPLRIGAIAAALMVVGGGVAAADPVSVPDVNQYVDTVDGYRLSASLTGLPGTTTATINPAANMAATAFSREGFLSGLATETIQGNGAKLEKATLRLWVQFGCQIDLRGGATTGGSALLSSLPLTFADILGAQNPIPVVGTAVPADSLNPSILANVKPGNIFRAELAKKEFDITKPGTASIPQKFHIAVRDTQVKVDGCGGPVSVRMIATAWMSTNTSDDWVNAYSDIVQL
jgi:hypothetical protein